MKVSFSFVLKVFVEICFETLSSFYPIQLFYKSYNKMVLNFVYAFVKNSFEKLSVDCSPFPLSWTFREQNI